MDKIIKLKKLFSVPDTNGASNFGGIATDGERIFCVKSNQAETVATLHQYRSAADTMPKRTKITGLGHTNGMTYSPHDKCIYICMWGQKHSENGLYRLNTENGSTSKVKGSFAPSNVAHYKDDLFICRTKTSSDKKTQTFTVIQVVNGAFINKKSFYVKNPKVSSGYTTNQDIHYHNGKLYIMETKSDLLKSAVLIADIGNPVSGKTYSLDEVWISSNTSKWEIETLTIDAKGNVLFGMNTASDGVYTMDEKVKSGDNVKVFNIVGGHSKYAPGASKYLDEVTEDRKIKNALIEILTKEGCKAYDCTSDAKTKNGCLTEQVSNCDKHAGIDVHIHFNAGTTDPNHKTTGTEVFVYSSSKCKTEAKKVCDNIASLGFTNRGVKYSTSLYVIRKSANPCMLIEVCFVDDKDDADLYNKLGAETIARKIAEALIGKTIEETGGSSADTSFKVRVITDDLMVRTEPSASSFAKGMVHMGDVYTIVDVAMNGQTQWGKLKSGEGYISLKFTERV